MTLTVRSTSLTGATTKGSALTHAEMDANWAHVIDSANQTFTPSGSGAVARPLQTKVRDSAVIVAADYDSAANYNAAANANGGALAIVQGTTSPGLTITQDLTSGSTKSPLKIYGQERSPGGTRYLTMIHESGNPGLLTNSWITINGAIGDPVPITISGNSTYMFGVQSDVGASPVMVMKGQSGDFIRFYSEADALLAKMDITGNLTAVSVVTATVDSGSTTSLSLKTNAGTTQAKVAHIASAVNWVEFAGAPTGNDVGILAQGSDTDVGLYIVSKGGDGIRFATNGSVNQVLVVHRASANDVIHLIGGVNGSSPPTIFAEGQTNVPLTISTKGSGTLRLNPNTGDIQWGKALVALGAGGAATLGLTGGSGPATTTQNTWLRLLDSTGAACWVPVWK